MDVVKVPNRYDQANLEQSRSYGVDHYYAEELYHDISVLRWLHIFHRSCCTRFFEIQEPSHGCAGISYRK